MSRTTAGVCRSIPARALVVAFVAMATMAPSSPAEKSPAKAADPPAVEQRQPTANPLLPQVAKENSRQMSVFKDKNGVPMMTNLPEKYRRKDGFKEVKLKFDPIVVPGRFRKLGSPSQYSLTKFAPLVRHYASKHRLDENLVYAVIKVESNGQWNAVSPAGARGLMQLMPGTAEDMGVKNPFDPAENIAGGTQYLAKLLELFNNNVSFALAGYNAGPETVKEYGGIPPFEETKNYVRDVLAYQKAYAKGGTRPSISASASAAAPKFSYLPGEEGKQYVVHFYSGLTQPADKIIDHDPYYYLRYQNRTYCVHKNHVKKIEKPK